MNYFRHYQLLVEKAKNRNIVVSYTEKHHIIPKCLGGDNSKNNLVSLTPEEHYVAHQLLVRMYPNNQKLINAAIFMCSKRPSNKLYGWLRRKYAEECKKKTGDKNNSYGTI